VPFFAVDQAATTSGTWMLAKMSKACIVPFVPRRKPDGKGYELIILPPECDPPLDDAETTAVWMNKVVEKCILMARNSICGCIAALKRVLPAFLLVTSNAPRSVGR
jgi:KDO2-lipid IV(A) lauroyltransferase